MENAIAVHMIHCFHELVHVHLHPMLWKVMAPSTNVFINVHIHELKDKGKSASWLIVKNLIQFDDVVMR